MKTLKILLSCLCLFALSACGSSVKSTPESCVAQFLDKILEINIKQAELMTQVQAGGNFDQNGWVQLNTDAMTLYKSLHCYNSEPTNAANDSKVEKAISRTIIKLQKMNEYVIVKAIILEDNESAMVAVDYNSGAKSAFALKKIDEKWLIELNN